MRSYSLGTNTISRDSTSSSSSGAEMSTTNLLERVAFAFDYRAPFALDQSLYIDSALEVTPSMITLSRNSTPLFTTRYIDVATIAEVRLLDHDELEKLRSRRWRRKNRVSARNSGSKLEPNVRAQHPIFISWKINYQQYRFYSIAGISTQRNHTLSL